MRPLRILQVTPYSDQAWAYGGIPRVVGALTRELAERGHQVTICATDAYAPRARLPQPAGVTAGPGGSAEVTSAGTLRVFPNISNRLAYDWQFFTPRGLSAFLRRTAAGFDVAHLHACHNLMTARASRQCVRTSLPYVLAPHGTAPRIERRRFAKLAFDWMFDRHTQPHAARVLAVSDAERQQLERLGVATDRIVVVPNPLDLAEFDPPLARGSFRRQHGLDDAELVVFLGKLTPRKRLDVLARAFAALDRPRTRLVIAGNDMGYGRALDDQVRALGLGARTMRPGLLAGRARLELLADADVVVYPAQDEVFGLVAVEALLCGSPVIVADDSGCGEVIGRTGGGLVVPVGDVTALARAIASVLDAPQTWRTVAADGAARVRELFSAPRVCDALELVYRDVIAGRAPRGGVA